jgi:hypothetical protein
MGGGAAVIAERIIGAYYNPDPATEGWETLALDADGAFRGVYAGAVKGRWGVVLDEQGRKTLQLEPAGIDTTWSFPMLLSTSGPLQLTTDRGPNLLVHDAAEEAAWFDACPVDACGQGTNTFREACFTPWHVQEGCLDTLCKPVLICDYPENKAALCAAEFGQGLTAGFGRLDGVVWAVLNVTDSQCPRPNSDHVIVQVVAEGRVYRMVVNVQSDRVGADPRVALFETPVAALDYAEGWHTGVRFDYAADANAHSADFTFADMTTLSNDVVARIPIGARISVFAHTSGGDSAHKVHRNASGQDGAVVIDPTGPDARALLFRFANQSF